MKRKSKVINVVKLTEKERKKFTKKFSCKRCHSFFVDTREELEHHMESLHGDYSLKKHQQVKGIDKFLHKLYLERNKMNGKPKEIEEMKLKPTECFICWCKNCGKIVGIHMDLSQELQDDITCPNCRANVFMDNRKEIVNFMVDKGLTPIKFRNAYGIDTTKFMDYEESQMKLQVKKHAFGDFLNRRNGK